MFKSFFRKYRFSEVETQHLIIGTLLFTGVMISLFIFDYLRDGSPETLLKILLLGLLTAPCFFLHEIGHKISAQQYNLWAEFRLDPQGALLTAISILLPFKFVAPGAVMIRANDYSEVPAMGKVAGFGPAVNVVIGGFYLIATGFFFIIATLTTINVGLLYTVFSYAAGFSFFLGVFNMLPFGPLDGKKVKYWNNNAFWILMSISLILAFETYISIIILDYGFFFFGSFLLGYYYLVLVYPLILGIITFFIGFNLIKKLSDPKWEPGKKMIVYNDGYETYREPQVRINRAPSMHSSSAPMNAPCTECGKKDLLPFRCTSCNKVYCADHRLPGKHFCVVTR
jgi:Zn-dependent protease